LGAVVFAGVAGERPPPNEDALRLASPMIRIIGKRYAIFANPGGVRSHKGPISIRDAGEIIDACPRIPSFAIGDFGL